MMAFQMTDIPLENRAVAEVMFRCIQKCGGAFDEALVQTKAMMQQADWESLRLGVGHILGADMHDMWSVIVRTHPDFLSKTDDDDGVRHP